VLSEGLEPIAAFLMCGEQPQSAGDLSRHQGHTKELPEKGRVKSGEAGKMRTLGAAFVIRTKTGRGKS
jgi:hypothetical protein